MILAINKETGTEITFDTLQQFEMAQTWGSFELKEEKHEPVEVVKLSTALKTVITGEKVAMKPVVNVKIVNSEFIKDEPLKVIIPPDEPDEWIQEEIKPIKKKDRPAKK